MWDHLRLPMGLAVVAVSAFAALGVAFSPDPTEQLPQVTPQVTGWLEMSRRFDAFNSLLVGLEEPASPLTADGLARLKRITDRLAALKASGVLAVSSITNVDSIRDGEDGSLETELLIPSVPQDPPGLEALSKKIAANLQVSGALISRDQRGYLIVIRADPRRPAAELARQIERTVDEERGPMPAAYFGAPFFTAVIARGVAARAAWLIAAAGFALLVLLGLVRRVWAVALVLVSTALSLVVCLGLVGALGLVLNLTSVTALLLVAVVAALAFSRALEGGRLPPVLARLAATGISALALSRIGFLAGLGAVLAAGSLAIAVVTVLIFAPLAKRTVLAPAAPSRPRFSPRAGLAVAVGVLLVSGWIASRARVFATPQTLFSASDEVGRSIDFFDRRFGGSDFIQIDFQGDLRDPSVAARLMRLTELLEGSPEFPDVRSAAQILGFLNHGFGGVHRIPSSRESLGALWFFLEGRPDVRNLVSDKRDEAMVVVRVASKPVRPLAELVQRVDAAVADSLQTGRAAARLRLVALVPRFQLAISSAPIEAALLAASAPLAEPERAALTGEVNARLHAWLASGDSPYQPGDEEWAQLKDALATPEAERTARLQEVAASFRQLHDPQMAGQLVESILSREKELRLNLRALGLARRLFTEEAARIRAQGIFEDLLDPHRSPGAATITVSGLPVVAAQLEHDLLGILWRGLALLLGVGTLVLFAFHRKPGAALRTVLEAAVATSLTVGIAGTLGPGIDSGCLTVFLLTPLASLMISDLQSEGRWSTAFLVGPGAAAAGLLFVGLAPVSRLGFAVMITLGSVLFVNAASRRF